MPGAFVVAPVGDEKKKSFFGRFKKADGQQKPKKEKKKKEKKVKAPKEKKPKTPKTDKPQDGVKRNMIGMKKKKPRAEYQAEIDELKRDLDITNAKYSELQRWAKNPPVAAY